MSNLINIQGAPELPKEAYFDTQKPNDKSEKNDDDIFKSVSANRITDNISKVCAKTDWAKINGIDSQPLNSETLYKNTMNGKSINNNMNVSTAIPQICKDQIQYLTCQLAEARTRIYDSSTFDLNAEHMSISKVFKTFSNLKPYLIVVFFVTIYLFINGVFGSLDVVGNVFSVIEKNSSSTIMYWVGLLIGLAIPIIILCVLYSKIVCGNLKNIEKYNITENPNGIKQTISGTLKRLDISMIVLLIFFIYSFTAFLFTVKRESLGNTLYTAIVGVIMLILAIFFYLMYAFIPFFSTAGTEKVDKENKRKLELFIDQQDDVSSISTNQHQDRKIKKTFMITFIIIFVLAFIFFVIANYDIVSLGVPEIIKDFAMGLFGSSAILVIPIIWVINFILAIQYFYIYPIIILVFRFIRYAMMASLYIFTNLERFSSLKDNFSDELNYQLDNFTNYSPTWGLIGIDVLKTILNIMGYENIFSKEVTDNNNENKDISQNKYISSVLMRFFVSENRNKYGMIISAIIIIITIVVGCIILFGVAKINPKKK